MLSTTKYGYILPFEVVSMLLLAAMIGCIVIAIKIKLPPVKVPALLDDENVIVVHEETVTENIETV